MDVIGWGLSEQLADGQVYSIGETEEILSFHEFLTQEGEVSVSPEDIQDIQVSGICSARLARTPLIYNAVLHLPMSLITDDPKRYVIIRVMHDPFLKLHDRELFAVDTDYMARGYSQAQVPDPTQSIFSARISRAPHERLKEYTNDYFIGHDDLKNRLDTRGWLSLNDIISINFLKDGNGVGGMAPEYVGTILNHNYKRELTDKLGVRVCEEAVARLYGPALQGVRAKIDARNARRNN